MYSRRETPLGRRARDPETRHRFLRDLVATAVIAGCVVALMAEVLLAAAETVRPLVDGLRHAGGM